MQQVKLSTQVSNLPGIGNYYSKKLNTLGISTVADLLYHFPFRHKDLQETTAIKNIKVGESVSILGQVDEIRNVFTKTGKKIQEASVSDGTGKIIAIWFNQIYLPKNIPAGTTVSLAGKVGFWGKKIALVSPDYEKIDRGSFSLHTQGLVPVYPETAGLSSRWLRKKIAALLPLVQKELVDPLTPDIKMEHQLVDLPFAIKNIHFPENEEADIKSRNRLAFDELLKLHLISLKRKNTWAKNNSAAKLVIPNSVFADFQKLLSFTLTSAQKKAIIQITTDLTLAKPMNRLLEGDVGSGKTAVAAFAIYASYLNKQRTVLMAPTQILANQHYQTLISIFKNTNIAIDLVTSATKKTRSKDADVYIGTHALIHNTVSFQNVALVIIDEQHRFGVEQRTHLIAKSKTKNVAPHVLTMTATPIPRTIALTAYGDLDLTTLDELPQGRQKTVTWIVPEKKRNGAYAWIKKQIAESGVQVFIVCPLIEESETEILKQVKAATVEHGKVKKAFSEYQVGLLHGRMKNAEKDKVLTSFAKNKTQILVSTPVIEVGVDFPNANIMVIEASERFGLAALHQLRGRVGRGTLKSYCLLFTSSQSKQNNQRLLAMTKPLNGFELAEDRKSVV